MTTQPEALRLADCLGQQWTLLSDQIKAANELRRLHHENQRYDAECYKLAKSWNDAERRCDQLLEALKDMLNAFAPYPWSGWSASELAAIDKARAAIKAAEENA